MKTQRDPAVAFLWKTLHTVQFVVLLLLHFFKIKQFSKHLFFRKHTAPPVRHFGLQIISEFSSVCNIRLWMDHVINKTLYKYFAYSSCVLNCFISLFWSQQYTVFSLIPVVLFKTFYRKSKSILSVGCSVFLVINNCYRFWPLLIPEYSTKQSDQMT